MSLFQAAEVGVHDGAVPVQGEDQGHVDADALAGHLGDRGQPFLGGRDLDVQVVPVHCRPQQACRLGGRRGVVAQPRVDLDRYAPVEPGCRVVYRRQDVAGGADVVGGHSEYRGIDVGVEGGQAIQLLVVAVAVGQGRGEDRRVGGYPDHVAGVNKRLQAAAGQQLAGQVVQPYCHPRGGQVGQRVMLWVLSLLFLWGLSGGEGGGDGGGHDGGRPVPRPVQADGGGEPVGEGFPGRVARHYSRSVRGDAGCFQDCGSVAPGAQCLAVAERFLQQDGQLDVAGRGGAAGHDEGVELDGPGGQQRPVDRFLAGTAGQDTANGGDDQGGRAKLGGRPPDLAKR